MVNINDKELELTYLNVNFFIFSGFKILKNS
jgi:hypothetical protein